MRFLEEPLEEPLLKTSFKGERPKAVRAKRCESDLREKASRMC